MVFAPWHLKSSKWNGTVVKINKEENVNYIVENEKGIKFRIEKKYLKFMG